MQRQIAHPPITPTPRRDVVAFMPQQRLNEPPTADVKRRQAERGEDFAPRRTVQPAADMPPLPIPAPPR
jgi:hypothetical protein